MVVVGIAAGGGLALLILEAAVLLVVAASRAGDAPQLPVALGLEPASSPGSSKPPCAATG